MMGAAALVCESAYRTGAGRVHIVSCESVVSYVLSKIPEVMGAVLPFDEMGYGEQAKDALNTFVKDLDIHSFVIGPGCGQTHETKVFLRWVCRFFADRGTPGVLDADVFYAIRPQDLQNFPMNSYILTPHAKEFSQFTSVTYDETNREEQALTLAQDVQQI